MSSDTTRPRPTAILGIILVSYVMIVLDISIVITGLPKIHAELGFTDAGLSWVSNAYTLTFGGFLLLGARAGDILGRRRMFIVGLVIFAAASLFIGLAPSSVWLVGMRALQGLGSAVLAPSTLALLQTSFPQGPERTRAVSYYAAAAGLSASIGLVLGGVLAEWLSWRVGFFINVPIAIGLIIMARRTIPETKPQRGTFDFLGAVTSTLGMSTLVFGIVSTASAGWSAPVTLEALAIGVLLLLAFVFIERQAKQPIMPLRLFASPARSGAYMARLLFLGANVGFFFFSTQFMQGVLGYSSAAAGLAFLPAMIVNFVAALAAPLLIVRIGGRNVLMGSLVLSLAGISWLALVPSDTTYLSGLALPMLLIGIGQGGALGPLTAFGITGVPVEDAGAASGLVNVAHQFGNSLGLGIQIAASFLGSAALAGTELLTSRINNAMCAAAVMVALALVVTFRTAPLSPPAGPVSAPPLSPKSCLPSTIGA